MNQHLQSLLHLIRENASLSENEKTALLNALKVVEKDLDLVSFKLDKTEKVKRTTAILLEETIAELEQKRHAVEQQKKRAGDRSCFRKSTIRRNGNEQA